MSSQRYTTSEIAQIEVYGRLDRLVSKMTNLSMTGAFLEMQDGKKPPRKGDLIRATFHFRSLGKTRILDAEVVWTNEEGFGISFLKRDQLLSRMFNRNGPEAGPQS